MSHTPRKRKTMPTNWSPTPKKQAKHATPALFRRRAKYKMMSPTTNTNRKWVAQKLLVCRKMCSQYAPTCVLKAEGQAFPLTKACLVITGDFLDRKSTRLNSSHLGISYAV